MGMQRNLTRVLLLGLCAVGLVTGGWAAFLPDSFYTDFPGVRPGWIAADGPFNEHLVRDVGGMFLALGVLAAGAFLARSVQSARLAGATWLVFSVVHAGYHFGHLHVYQPVDQWLNAAGLVASVVVALVVLALPPRRAPAPDGAAAR